jgi:hypothetical protein
MRTETNSGSVSSVRQESYAMNCHRAIPSVWDNLTRMCFCSNAKSTIIHSMELGKPYAFPMGRSLVRDDNDAEGRGFGKKQMAARNKLYRGIALIRKDADFPLVSHCMNRDKLRNMRKSITPNGEILIDTKCYWAVSWNYRGRIENCRPISKGYGMLEPYAVKVASTVLRRGRAGNRSSLFDY